MFGFLGLNYSLTNQDILKYAYLQEIEMGIID